MLANKGKVLLDTNRFLTAQDSIDLRDLYTAYAEQEALATWMKAEYYRALKDDVNLKQVIAITLAVLGVLMISTTQMTELFGPTAAKSIAAGAGFVNSILASVLWSGNGLTAEQWGAVGMVFSGLLSSSWYKHRNQAKSRGRKAKLS